MSVHALYTVSGLTVIFNIFGVKLLVKLFAMKFGTGVGVHEIVVWAKFDL